MKTYLNRETSARNGGGNPVLNRVIRKCQTTIERVMNRVEYIQANGKDRIPDWEYDIV